MCNKRNNSKTYLVGVFGKPVALEDGRTLTADENYVRQCIVNSQEQVVKGFPPIMPVCFKDY